MWRISSWNQRHTVHDAHCETQRSERLTYSSHVLIQHVEYICYRLPPRSDSIHHMTYCTALILDNTNVLPCKPHCNLTVFFLHKALLLHHKVLQHYTLHFYILDGTLIACAVLYSNILYFLFYCMPTTLWPGSAQHSTARVRAAAADWHYLSSCFLRKYSKGQTSHWLINSFKVSFSPCICKGSISPHFITPPFCFLPPDFPSSPLTFLPERI